jgi:hypothetical protein
MRRAGRKPERRLIDRELVIGKHSRRPITPAGTPE